MTELDLEEGRQNNQGSIIYLVHQLVYFLSSTHSLKARICMCYWYQVGHLFARHHEISMVE